MRRALNALQHERANIIYMIILNDIVIEIKDWAVHHYGNKFPSACEQNF